MQLDHWPKFQKLHIYSLSTLGVDIELIFSLWAEVKEIDQFLTLINDQMTLYTKN